MGKSRRENLERFRDTVDKFQKKREKEGWVRIEYDDEFLIDLALEVAIEYFGGDEECIK